MPAPQTPARESPALPPADAFRKFHEDLPLKGDPPADLLSFPDDVLLYIVAAVRNSPREPPVMAGEEWDRLIDLLSQHRILPLMRSHLRSWPVACRPPREAAARIDRIFLRGAARNLIIGRQLQPVFTAMQDAGIPVVLLKGQALARTIYEDPAIRQSYDIDLLVQPEHVDACDAVLRDLGYSCPVRHFTKSQAEVHHDDYFPPGQGAVLELHWTPSYTIPLFPEDWLSGSFDRKILIHGSDLSCYTLDPLDHLLYLIFHNIVQHYTVRIDWICDMAYLMESLRVPENWENLRARCVGMHLVIPLQYALTAADLWCGVKIPQGSAGFSPLPPPSAEDIRIWEHAKKRRLSLRSSVFLSMQGLPTTRKKLHFLYSFVLPPVERMGKYRKSPSDLDIPLAHLRRWFSILKFHKIQPNDTTDDETSQP